MSGRGFIVVIILRRTRLLYSYSIELRVELSKTLTTALDAASWILLCNVFLASRLLPLSDTRTESGCESVSGSSSDASPLGEQLRFCVSAFLCFCVSVLHCHSTYVPSPSPYRTTTSHRPTTTYNLVLRVAEVISPPFKPSKSPSRTATDVLTTPVTQPPHWTTSRATNNLTSLPDPRKQRLASHFRLPTRSQRANACTLSTNPLFPPHHSPTTSSTPQIPCPTSPDTLHTTPDAFSHNGLVKSPPNAFHPPSRSIPQQIPAFPLPQTPPPYPLHRFQHPCHRSRPSVSLNATFSSFFPLAPGLSTLPALYLHSQRPYTRHTCTTGALHLPP